MEIVVVLRVKIFYETFTSSSKRSSNKNSNSNSKRIVIVILILIVILGDIVMKSQMLPDVNILIETVNEI